MNDGAALVVVTICLTVAIWALASDADDCLDKLEKRIEKLEQKASGKP